MTALLADDLIWTHENGGVDTRNSYLAKLGGVRFEAIDVLSEDVLIIGDAATFISEFAMTLHTEANEELKIRSTATSFWSLDTTQPDAGWKMRRFHSGNLAD